MSFSRVLLALNVAAAGAALPWPFSYARVPTLAFPGALPRFFTAAETLGFVSNFSSMNIWGLNVTCVDADGGLRPAVCPASASKCSCDLPVPETQRFLLNQEAALPAQATALKAAAAAAGVPFFPVLGYVRASYLQMDFAAQAAVALNASFAPWLLVPERLGRAIDCYVDRCSFQGTEYRVLDFGVPAAVAFSAQQIVGSMINGSALDGLYLDSLQDVWAVDCPRLGCSPSQSAAQFNGSLAHVAAVYAVAAAVGKVVSSSTHFYSGDYYEAYLAILLQYPQQAIRFWEFFNPHDATAIAALQREVALGVAQQVHVGSARTLAPDWVELAAFLIAAGDHCYFSCSGPWNVDSFTVYPEFTRRMGPPLGPGMRNGTAEAPWALLSAVNLAAGLPPCHNCSVPGVLGFLGNFSAPSACLAAVRANASFVAMTHIGTGGEPWVGTCWGRLDAQDWPGCVNAPVPGCHAVFGQAFATAAISDAFTRFGSTWRRSFEHLDVVFDAAAYTATLSWH
jgi:hypothetical protein